jgi:hypothetical protein
MLDMGAGECNAAMTRPGDAMWRELVRRATAKDRP